MPGFMKYYVIDDICSLKFNFESSVNPQWKFVKCKQRVGKKISAESNLMGGFLTVRIKTHFPLIIPNIDFTQIFV